MPQVDLSQLLFRGLRVRMSVVSGTAESCEARLHASCLAASCTRLHVNRACCQLGQHSAWQHTIKCPAACTAPTTIKHR